MVTNAPADAPRNDAALTAFLRADESGNDALTEFLRDAAAREFRLGAHDCGLWLADWYIAATGRPDPAEALRGASYAASELAAKMLPIIESLGLEETQTPGRGDIGIVQFRSYEIGAIFASQWMTFGEHGLRALPIGLGFSRAWKVA